MGIVLWTVLKELKKNSTWKVEVESRTNVCSHWFVSEFNLCWFLKLTSILFIRPTFINSLSRLFPALQMFSWERLETIVPESSVIAGCSSVHLILRSDMVDWVEHSFRNTRRLLLCYFILWLPPITDVNLFQKRTPCCDSVIMQTQWFIFCYR